MSKMTGYFKIIEPKLTGVDLQGDGGLPGGGVSGTYGWYNTIVQGAAGRINAYRQYDVMDDDVDISQALDTLSEEMAGNNAKTDDPLDIKLIASGAFDIPDNTILTLETALTHWGEIHGLDTQIFNIARIMLKYGDCFFQKSAIHKKWLFVHPRDVTGAIVSKDDINTVLGWKVTKKGMVSQLHGYGQATEETIPNDEMVRFTLNDQMSESAPFGVSVLRAVYRTFRQKEMMEDAMIIYRVQRAPERRVFHVDVGKMPANKIKKYLEGIKIELKQKNVPSFGEGTEQVDAIYNPMSMQEDMFFASRGDGKGSRVDTLPGGTNGGETSELDYFVAKTNRGLKIPSSYSGGDTDSVGNDGKVGVAYIQELRFYKYIERLQSHIERVIDVEFKAFLKTIDINIDEMWYKVQLPESANFGAYRQQELDASLLTTFGNASDVDFLSKRFVLAKYLQLTDAEILENERLLREEKGIDDSNDIVNVQKIYQDNVSDEENPMDDSGIDVEGVVDNPTTT